MALLMEHKISNLDVIVPNCYWKIENNGIVGDKNKINVRISCYKNKIIADTNSNKLSDFDFITMIKSSFQQRNESIF